MATAQGEWKRGWPLPFIGMLGYTGAACFAYSSGVFMEVMNTEFGWSRAAFSSSFTFQTLTAMLAMSGSAGWRTDTAAAAWRWLRSHLSWPAMRCCRWQTACLAVGLL